MDLRKHGRATTEEQCKASFEFGGQRYKDISVANLGADGCCLEIPSKDAKGFKNLSMLEDVELAHPTLSKQRLEAKVIWLHSKKGAEKEYVETGIQFSGAPETFCKEVDHYVTALLKSNPATDM